MRVQILETVREHFEKELNIRKSQPEGLRLKVYDQMLFESKELYGYLTNTVPVANSIYEEVVFDSNIERAFAEAMSTRTDIKLCVKLPPWFLVETPIGKYNPDWAIVMQQEQKVYLVRETKGTLNVDALAPDERDRVACGGKHFGALGVDFAVATVAADVAFVA